MLFRGYYFNYKKTALYFLAVFFIYTRVLEATISSSRNYKLYTGMAGGAGGGKITSTTYNGQNTVGGPVNTSPMTGTNYKIYAGVLSTINAIPEVEILSYNDGLIIYDDTPTLEWSYVDKDGDPQRYYQIQISKDNFITKVVDTGLVRSKDTSYTTPILPTEEAGVSYRWRIRVSDGFDYSGWKVATNGFRLITKGMEIPIIWARVSPGGKEIPAKLWQDCNTPYMQWEYPVTGVEIAGYSYAWGSLPDDQLDTRGTSYQTPPGLLDDGVRVFNLKAQNTAGNWSDVASFEIWIDRSAPNIGIYLPSNGSIVSTDKPTISIDVSDDKSGVDPGRIEMKINKTTVIASYDDATKKVVYIPSIPLSEGNNVVSFEASDYVGNRTTQLVWSFVVDTIGPLGSVIINNEDAVTNSIYVNLSLTARDATTVVTEMIISNDGVFDTEQWEPFVSRKENWILPAITGTRKVYVKFKDSAGNESQVFSDTIELVIIAPDTIITSGPSMVTTSTTALFTFKGSIPDCVFRWRFDSEDWSEWSRLNLVIKKDLSEGNHYFKVQAAKDLNNNGKIDIDEMDPVPEERTWTINKKGTITVPPPPKKTRFRFWKEE